MTARREKQGARAAAWPVALAVVIFLFSHQSRVVAPEVTGFDKMAHFWVYGLLATLICRIRPGLPWAAASLLLASGYGALDEWHQSFVPGRSATAGDWVADTCGATVAVCAYAGWPAYRALLERSGRAKVRIENSGRHTPDSEQ